MNNKVIVASLSKIANELDSLGKFEEANEVTSVMVKVSQSMIGNANMPSSPNMQNTVPSGGVDPKMTSVPPGPYMDREEDAQSWINKKSQSVSGDINQILSMAEAGLKNAQNAQNETEKKKFNDVLYILRNNPKYKKFIQQREEQLKKVKLPGYAPATGGRRYFSDGSFKNE
jgi:hypothetical protein